jgi:hypothetical protein
MPRIRKIHKKDPLLYPKLLNADELEILIYNDLPIIQLYPRAKVPVEAISKEFLHPGEESYIICDQGAVYSVTSFGRVLLHNGKDINAISYQYKTGKLKGEYSFHYYTPCGKIDLEEAFAQAGWDWDSHRIWNIIHDKGFKIAYT